MMTSMEFLSLKFNFDSGNQVSFNLLDIPPELAFIYSKLDGLFFVCFYLSKSLKILLFLKRLGRSTS